MPARRTTRWALARTSSGRLPPPDIERPPRWSPSHNPGKLNLVQRVPVGVVGAITPWNAPFVPRDEVIAPAIALGNTVVMKPTPQTPITERSLIAEMFADAGAPPGPPGGRRRRPGSASTWSPTPPTWMITSPAPRRWAAEIRRIAAWLSAFRWARQQQRLGRARRRRARGRDHDRRLVGVPLPGADLHHGESPRRRREAVRPLRRAPHGAREGDPVGDPATDEVGLGPMISEEQRDRGHDILDGRSPRARASSRQHVRGTVLQADRRRGRPRRRCRSGGRRSSRRSPR